MIFFVGAFIKPKSAKFLLMIFFLFSRSVTNETFLMSTLYMCFRVKK